MALGDDTLDEHAQRRRDLLLRARNIAAAGPAVAILLEGTLMPKRAAAYQTAPAVTPVSNPVQPVQPVMPVVTAIGTGTGSGMLTDRCGVAQPI